MGKDQQENQELDGTITLRNVDGIADERDGTPCSEAA